MLGRRDTRDAFRKLREATDLDRDGDVQRLEEELKRAREQLRMHDQDKAGWKDEVKRLERELEESRERVQRRVAEKLREVRDEARAIASERADDRAMKRKADRVEDKASGLADDVEGDDDTPGISREERIKGYGEILDDLIDLEEEEHDEIEDVLKKRQAALESASDALVEAYTAWLKRASQLANNINDPTARARAQELITELKSATTAGVDVSGDISPSNIDDLAEELQELIDEHVDDRHINDQDREAEEELDEAREKLREARGDVEEVLDEIDELETFRAEIAAWLESLDDDEEWDDVRKALKKKLKQLDGVLGSSQRDRAARLRRYWEEVSLPSGFPVTPGPRRGRGILVGVIAAGVGVGLLVGQVFGGGNPADSLIEDVAIQPTTATATATHEVTVVEFAPSDDTSADDAPVDVTATPAPNYDLSDFQRRHGPLQIVIQDQPVDDTNRNSSNAVAVTDDQEQATITSQSDLPQARPSATSPETGVSHEGDTGEISDANMDEAVKGGADGTPPAIDTPSDDSEAESGDSLETVNGSAIGERMSSSDQAQDTEDAVSAIETSEGVASVVSAVECIAGVECGETVTDETIIALPPETPSTD